MELLHFVALAKPKRKNFLQEWTQEEKAIMAQHFAYVEKLQSEDKLILSGACLDGAFGMLIYKAESQEAAFHMFENDPLTQSGIAETEFHPFSVGKIQYP